MAPTRPTPRSPKAPSLIPLATIPAERIRWFWYPYIPYGVVTMLFGRGGIGKSHITVDLASRVSRGAGMPLPSGTDEPTRPPGNVLMLSAEDDYGAVLRPRLEAVDANLSRIYVPSALFTLDAAGLKQVESYAREVSPDLIIIDPVVYFVGGKMDIYRANETRSFTGPLNDIAKRTGAAVLVVHHQKKGKAESHDDMADLAAGSADFNNSARASLFIRHANDGTPVMSHVKHNYGPKGPAWSFELDDGFRWTGTYDESGDWEAGREAPTGGQGLGRPRGSGDQRNAAIAFLRAALASGPVPSREIEARASDEAFSKRTLNRAKIDAGVESFVRVAPDGSRTWFWRLRAKPNAPHSNPPEAPAPHVPEVPSVAAQALPAAGPRAPEVPARPDPASARGPLDPGARASTPGPVGHMAGGRPAGRVPASRLSAAQARARLATRNT